jgi:hypothetical protein|tara:strand:+ start:322 stop:498 length:177 start_codon:yes stop_codon:yes gene_type:complete
MDKKDLKYWRECLKSALRQSDMSYAMQCDKEITKLKKKKIEQGLDVPSDCYIQFNHKQ